MEFAAFTYLLNSKIIKLNSIHRTINVNLFATQSSNISLLLLGRLLLLSTYSTMITFNLYFDWTYHNQNSSYFVP